MEKFLNQFKILSMNNKEKEKPRIYSFPLSFTD